MVGMKDELMEFKQRAELIPYETGKVVRNWAQTFECQPERFYYPKSEDEVVEVPSDITDCCCDRFLEE